MTTIKPALGGHLYDTLKLAVERAPAIFTFNGLTFTTRLGEPFDDARRRFKDEHGFEVKRPEELEWVRSSK
jgi:hypothetical protein